MAHLRRESASAVDAILTSLGRGCDVRCDVLLLVLRASRPPPRRYAFGLPGSPSTASHPGTSTSVRPPPRLAREGPREVDLSTGDLQEVRERGEREV